MNPLQRTLIEKAGYANGWENVRESTQDQVVMYSARHKAEAIVTPIGSDGSTWHVAFPKGPPTAELAMFCPLATSGADHFQAQGELELGKLLRRAAELAMSLPSHAVDLFATEVAKIEANPPSTTEALALTKRRVGQDLFRKALMEYWGGACAVTGINIPELLRASHAKPWAHCASDAERLDAFNGFLLSALFDALFDSGLITFHDDGRMVVSTAVGATQQQLLGLDTEALPSLRWISPNHLPYLAWHREKVFINHGGICLGASSD